MKHNNGFQMTVRLAINSCGITRAELSRQTGVSESMLSRFMAGQTDMSLGLLEHLAPLIGIDVVSKPVGVKRGKRKG